MLAEDGPASARTYDYLLHGHDWHEADRDLGDALLALDPSIGMSAAEHRAYIVRAVEWAAMRGCTQFLDAGCGMLRPGSDIADIARGTQPEARVVYADSDKLAAEYAACVTHDDPLAGAVHADLRDIEGILESSPARLLLNLAAPMTLIFGGSLHYFPLGEARRAVAAWARSGLRLTVVVTVPHYRDAGLLERVREVYSPAEVHSFAPWAARKLLTGMAVTSPGVGWAGGSKPGWEAAPPPPAGRGVYPLGAVAVAP